MVEKIIRDVRKRRRKEYFTYLSKKSDKEIKTLLKNSNRCDITIVNFFISNRNRICSYDEIKVAFTRLTKCKGIESLLDNDFLVKTHDDKYRLNKIIYEKFKNCLTIKPFSLLNFV